MAMQTRPQADANSGLEGASASGPAAISTTSPSNTPRRRPPGSGCEAVRTGRAPDQRHGNGAHSEYDQRNHAAGGLLNSAGGEKSGQPVVVIKAVPPSLRRVHRRIDWRVQGIYAG